MIVTEMRCDRCNERISEGRPYHTIQWRETTNGVERINNGEYVTADLCDDCYNTMIKQDLAQYGYRPVLDLSLLKKGV